MNDYPSINDFLTEGEKVALNEDVEREIIQFMEDFALSVESNETEAFTHASTIVLNC